MELHELKCEINSLFNPDLDDDASVFLLNIPHSRLSKHHKLDVSYMDSFSDLNYEGSSMDPNFRLCSLDEDVDRLHLFMKNYDVPNKFFTAALKLFADSVIVYHEKTERKGDIRYYPSVVLTFWSGFETFVRYYSELMLLTVKSIPQLVADYLRDLETYLDKNGAIKKKKKYQSVLDRYAILLRYGYNFQVNRGCKYWQSLEKAKKLRDYYTHLDVGEPRSLSSAEVLEFLEAVFLGIIWPSTELQRTIILGIYNVYAIYAELRRLAQDYVEQPFFLDWCMNNNRLIYCNFENVDESRFMNQ